MKVFFFCGTSYSIARIKIINRCKHFRFKINSSLESTSDVTVSELIIHKASPEDSGNYSCVASNPYGRVIQNYQLQVHGNERFIANYLRPRFYHTINLLNIYIKVYSYIECVEIFICRCSAGSSWCHHSGSWLSLRHPFLDCNRDWCCACFQICGHLLCRWR